ncbi:FKBP-type peptidyl-prolyl cis-trans isomerase [Leifsonia bigeumensis]|uniref:Peptidyl-prolyl cis-trans isomerase n=1 Tax=Leifsonella bigeumensis TaxID=433643 RepID=A0ABP7FS00_9MICO
MRTLPVLLLAAGIIASLTSCAQGPFGSGCDSPVSSGDASEVVTATGEFGSTPTIDFPTPVVTKKTERSTLIAGDGEELHDGDVAVFKYTLLNGSTGAVLSQSDYSGLGTIVTLGDSATSSVTVGLRCTTVGSRVAIATTAEGAGQANSGSTDSFVFVVDVLDAFPGKANGTAQIPQAGMPAVVTAPNGAPGITIPKQDPPSKLAVNVLQAGHGEQLEAGDHIVVKYTAVLWSDSSVFDSTWTDGQAKIITLTKSDTVTEGLVTGLVGQKIGSQVLVVVPPAQGYGDAGSNNVPSGSTLVYVVDLLGLAG